MHGVSPRPDAATTAVRVWVGGPQGEGTSTLAARLRNLGSAFVVQAAAGESHEDHAALAATPDKSVRITWDDGTPVDIWLTAKGDSKSSVAVAHRKLASRDDANRRKEYWGERLDALAKILTA